MLIESRSLGAISIKIDYLNRLEYAINHGMNGVPPHISVSEDEVVHLIEK